MTTIFRTINDFGETMMMMMNNLIFMPNVLELIYQWKLEWAGNLKKSNSSIYLIFILHQNFSFFDNVSQMKIHTVETRESCLHEVCS